MMSNLSSNIRLTIQRHLEGGDNVFCSHEVVHKRGGNRGGLLRLALSNDSSVVVKVWLARNLKERLKANICLSNARREWHMHRLIYNAGVGVPRPFAFYRLTIAGGTLYEAMALEDLGATTQALPYLKQLIADGNELAVTSFENSVIKITEMLLRLRVLDIDHQLNNFVVDAGGRLIRVDFECARCYRFRLWHQKEYAEMLARLLASHIYAVQPEVTRSVSFAERLYNKLSPNSRTKSIIAASVNDKLALQLARKGVATTLSLPI